jgi:hypothetical protein
MKKSKRRIALLFAAMMILTIVPMTGASADSNLQLTSMCYDEATGENVWRVRNHGDEDVDYTWRKAGSTESGEGTASPGDSYFRNSRTDGPDTTIVEWEGGSTTKAANNLICDPAPDITKEACQADHEQFEFRNQGQCIRYANTGKDSR